MTRNKREATSKAKQSQEIKRNEKKNKKTKNQTKIRKSNKKPNKNNFLFGFLV